MPSRVYADTSVIGGVFDPNFAIDSTWIFEEVARGSLILLVSNVLEAEVSESPNLPVKCSGIYLRPPWSPSFSMHGRKG